MAILYAPTIETPLKAIYANDDNIVVFNVPIVNNKVISTTEYDKFSLLIKNASTGSVINKSPIFSKNNIEATFEFDGDLLVLGQYYKIQIAYATNGGQIGYYSGNAVVKYTGKPNITAEAQNNILSFVYDNADASEKIYEYSISIYNNNNKLLHSTGDLLHNRDNGNIDMMVLPTDLSDNVLYTVRYHYKTINLLEDDFDYYCYGSVKATSPVFQSGKAKLVATLDKENGRVKIGVENNGASLAEISGNYIIKRLTIDPQEVSLNYDERPDWDIIGSFATTSDMGLSDFTIENGKTYIYGIQQYNQYGVYSQMAYSQPIVADFEYMFLYDGERQLRIAFNPKISSFKNTILESKVETIGSQFPYIFRNGTVKYKEFPVEGLLSKLEDEEHLFFYNPYPRNESRMITPHAFGAPQQPNEVMIEKDFKLSALEWLSNGRPKLFRSPTEGNYIVRLLNTSLSPMDQLGRMLHTFQATAYEVDGYSNENLIKHKIIRIDDKDFVNEYTNEYYEHALLDEMILKNIGGDNLSIFITGAVPLPFESGPDTSNSTAIKLYNSKGESQIIYIGLSGQYILHPGQADVVRFEVLSNPAHRGTIEYTYSLRRPIPFAQITKVDKDKYSSVNMFEGDVISQIAYQSIVDKYSIELRDAYVLQIFRKYNRATDADYTFEIETLSDARPATIDMSTVSVYEVKDLHNLITLKLGDGLFAVLMYKRVHQWGGQ